MNKRELDIESRLIIFGAVNSNIPFLFMTPESSCSFFSDLVDFRASIRLIASSL